MKITLTKKQISTLSILSSLAVIVLVALVISFYDTYRVGGAKWNILYYIDKFLFLTILTNITILILTILCFVKYFTKFRLEKFNYFLSAVWIYLMVIFAIYWFFVVPVTNMRHLSFCTWFVQITFHLLGMIMVTAVIVINWNEFKVSQTMAFYIYLSLFFISWYLFVELTAVIKYFCFNSRGIFNIVSDRIPYSIIDPVAKSWFHISPYVSNLIFLTVIFCTINWSALLKVEWRKLWNKNKQA